MTSDESIMEEMLDRATNPTKATVDELGVQMFCIVVRSNVQLVQKAQEMIVAKIRSSNVVEATRAISLLEECMTKCGATFQDETAKFRFLNELICLVSKKFQGAETSRDVKQRIMECLLLWTTEFPRKQKVREAYDMLRKEGGFELGQTAHEIVKQESVLGSIDEETFVKLVKSNNPENFKRANLLLQYRINQQTRRDELLLQHKTMLQEVQNTIQVLNQMLDSYERKDEDERETIRELYKTCKKHKPMFHHLTELWDQSDTELIADTLEANNALLTAMQRYNEIVASPAKNLDLVATTETSNSSGPTLLREDFFVEMLDDLLTSKSTTLGVAGNNEVKSSQLKSSAGVIDNAVDVSKTKEELSELQNIFDSILTKETMEGDSKQTKYPTDLFKNMELLEPEQVETPSSFSVENSDKFANGITKSTMQNTITRTLPEIDAISDELFQKVIPPQERLTSFKRECEKVTLNDLARERINEDIAGCKSVTDPILLKTSTPLDDDNILDNDSNSFTAAVEEVQPNVVDIVKADAMRSSLIQEPILLPAKHLSDINIDLDSITPKGEERIIFDDDDMQLSLIYTEERPSKNVAVVVIAAQNKSKQTIKGFQFEASVKKPCKVRLLPPTSNNMPPHKRFRPSTPINQVMLLLNPTGIDVDVFCIVGFKLGDDPDPVKESFVVKGMPFVD